MAQQNMPFAFFFDGNDVHALKYRDGEFHSDLSALYRPYSGFRELGMSDDSYARAYMSCVWAFRAINVRVQKVSDVLRRGQLIDKTSGRLITQHAYLAALEYAYQLYQQDVYEEWVFSRGIYGEAYVEKVKQVLVGTFGIPRTLRVLNSLSAEPIIERGVVKGYRYRDDSGGVDFAPDEVVYDRTKNPLDDTRGFSLLAAAMDAVNIDRSIIILTRSHLKNNARPGLIFTPKQGRLSQADVDMIQTTLAEDSKGPQNAGNPLLMPTAFDVTVAEPPKLDDLGSSAEEQKRRICSAVGVPVALIDYTDMAYQLSPEQNRTFYELTLIPEADKIVRVINAQVLPFFDPRRTVELRLPVDDIRAELGDPVQRTTIYSQQLQVGAITLNEYRQRLGHQPTPDGDVYFLPLGVQIVKAGQIGAPPAPPVPTPESPPPAAVPVPSPDAAPGKAVIEDELRKWRARATKGNALKAFTTATIPKHLEEFIRAELEVIGAKAGKALVHAVFDDAEMIAGFGFKAYDDTRTAFVQEMIRIIGEGQRSEVSRQKFGGQMRSALRRFGLVAFRDGMNSEGYDPESFSPKELATFRSWQEETSGYISGLGSELFKEGGIAEGEVALRADMWAEKSLRDVFYRGAKLAAPNKPKRWKRNPMKDSCTDCLARDGQVKTYAEWEQIGLPGSHELSCRGFACGCELVDP